MSKKVTVMNCAGNLEELVECARRRSDPGPALKSHLRTCGGCFERWEAERELAANLRFLRMESASKRSSSAARMSVMHEFESRHTKVVRPFWYWGFATAVALLLALLLGPETIARLHPAQPPASALETAAANPGDSAGDPDSDGFIAVPYAPPLATGEMVRIVHTELNPAALATLGVTVDPSWTTQLPADLLEGEDGMPRAVRVSEGEVGESGF